MHRLFPKCNRAIAGNRNILTSLQSARFLSASNYYDVIISGVGLVGGSMGCALGSSPYFEKKKVLLLESQSPPTLKKFTPNQPYSNRVCAISPKSKMLMERLGFWDKIGRKCAVKKMQVWDALSNSAITFDEDNMNTDLCYVIENDLMVSSIYEILNDMKSDNFTMLYDSKITSVELPRNYANENKRIPEAHVTLNNGEELECGLLIAADGANSIIPTQANIQKVTWKYGQTAVVATLKLSESTNNITAWQRFLPHGPIAILPLDEEHSSLVWSTTPEHAKELLSLDEENLVSEVNNAFCENYRQDDTVKYAEEMFKEFLAGMNANQETPPLQIPPSIVGVSGKPGCFPLGLSHSNYYVKPRLALIGDCAHKIHPLAGQGANLGFGDVSSLTEILEQAVGRGSDLGCMLHLSQYESERQLYNMAFSAATDSLNRLYSTSSTPAVLLRSLGLMGTSVTEPLKKFLMKQAMS